MSCEHCNQPFGTYANGAFSDSPRARNSLLGLLSLGIAGVAGLLLWSGVAVRPFHRLRLRGPAVQAIVHPLDMLLVCGTLLGAAACIRRERHPWVSWAGLLLSFTALYFLLAMQN